MFFNAKINHEKKHKKQSKSLMLNGIGFVTGDPTIKLNYPFVFHPGIQVTVTEPGDAKWIYMMLPLCKGDLITEIRVVYHKSDTNADIALARLVTQESPTSVTIAHNQKIKQELAGTLTLKSPCNVEVKTSVVLKLCLNFADTDDMIEFGAIEITYIPEYSSPDVSKKLPRQSMQNEKMETTKQLQSKLSELLFFFKI